METVVKDMLKMSLLIVMRKITIVIGGMLEMVIFNDGMFVSLEK